MKTSGKNWIFWSLVHHWVNLSDAAGPVIFSNSNASINTPGAHRRYTIHKRDVFCVPESQHAFTEKYSNNLQNSNERSFKDACWNQWESIISHCWTYSLLTRAERLLTTMKKPDYSLQLHMGTNILISGGISCGLIKLKLNCFFIISIIVFREQRGKLAWEHHPNCKSTGVVASWYGAALL